MRWLPLIAILISLPGCSGSDKQAVAVSELNGPISLTLDIDGRFKSGWPWTLDVDDDGTAKLTIAAFPTVVSRSFTITQLQIEELRSILITERFFELSDEYGERVPDGSTQTLTVTCGDYSHTVELHFLMNWVHGETWRLREPARALRIWKFVRTWFNEIDAVDLQKYDDMVLTAAAS